MNTYLRFLLLIALLATTRSLHAEPPAANEVSVEFSLYAWNTDLPRLRYSETDVISPVTASMRSAQHTYTGSATIYFYGPRADLRSGEGKPPRPLTSATFPPGSSRFTLLTQSEGVGRYRMHVIPENGDLLPLRFVQLHNFTEHRLFVSYDKDSAVQIPPSGTAYIRPAGDVTVIEVSRADGAKWRKLFNNVIELNPDKRGNVIFAADRSGQISIHSLPAWPRKLAEKKSEDDTPPLPATPLPEE